MSSVSAVLLLAWNVMFMCEIGLPLAEGTYCTSNSDCLGKIFNNVCCGRYFYSKKCQPDSCIGWSCSIDGDCGGKGECCISNRCTKYGCTECHSNNDCASYRDSQYCCKHRYRNDHNVCRRSCVGETCRSNLDCGGPSEYCTSNKICWKAGRSCSSNSDCRGDGECCRISTCVTCSSSCTSNSDCASSRYCCKRGSFVNVCYKDCVGETCYDNDDCGGPGEFCNTKTMKCEKSKTNTVAGWVIALAVVGAVLFVIFVGAVWAHRFCRGSSRPGVVVRAEPARGTSAIIGLRETETTTHPAPVYNIPPPSYDNHGKDFPSPQTHQLPPELKQGMPQPQHGYLPPQLQDAFPPPQNTLY